MAEDKTSRGNSSQFFVAGGACIVAELKLNVCEPANFRHGGELSGEVVKREGYFNQKRTSALGEWKLQPRIRGIDLVSAVKFVVLVANNTGRDVLSRIGAVVLLLSRSAVRWCRSCRLWAGAR